MKLLHFADLHLGVENYGRPDAATGLSTRLGDFLRTFDEVIDYAIAERVDAVLFAGDAFKTRDPNPTVQRAFAQRILRLSRAAIPTVLLVGNHDLPSVLSRATSVDIYDTLAIEHVRVCRKLEHFTLETRAGPLQVVALPWITRSALLAREDYQAASMEEVEQRLTESLGAALEGFAAEVAERPDVPAVLLGHLSLHGATYSSEQSIMLGRDLTLNRATLQPAAFDYVALGHIHKHQQVGPDTPPVVYSGSLERIDFGEEREQKGFVVVEITPGDKEQRRTQWSFRPVAARRFVTLRLSAGAEEPLADLRRAIEARDDVRDAVVRAFVATTPEGAAKLRLPEVRRLLVEAGAAFVGQLGLEVERASRVRLPLERGEELDPARMLARWLEAQRVPPERRETLLRYAETLLKDE